MEDYFGETGWKKAGWQFLRKRVRVEQPLELEASFADVPALINMH